jgi:hypothetical protein
VDLGGIQSTFAHLVIGEEIGCMHESVTKPHFRAGIDIQPFRKA